MCENYDIKSKLVKVSDYIYEIPQEGTMNVPGRVFLSDDLLKQVDDKTLQQVKNVASLPGIQKHSLAMPDMHLGYGFSIGGVAAFDANEGLITPGGIGFDINCGVRVLTTSLTKEDVLPKIDELLDQIFKRVGVGVGSESQVRLSDKDLDDVLTNGVDWAIKNGYGTEDDKLHCESQGILSHADPSKVSPRAKARGRKQLGTIGAGNHFVEIQYVDKIEDVETAKAFGIEKEGQIVVMIHCGSRGLGHQVCSDYLRKMEDHFPDIFSSLPEKDLIYAPIKSQIAQDYFKAMSAAANFAWANRHICAHFVKQAFNRVFDIDADQLKTLYDVSHNIAKLEKHFIGDTEKDVYVHRKGATRAFGPGNKELPEHYQKTGQPVLLPGSMGTASYILVGTQKAMEVSFGSTAHGAGRALSRHAAKKQYTGEQIKKELANQNIHVKGATMMGIAEECPMAYKDVHEVVKVSHEIGIGNIVARVRPLGVIKG